MLDFGSSCDWNTPLKKGLGLATLDPTYGAPERRLDYFRPALRFDVYSAGLIALRVALPSLTSGSAMERFVSDVLSKARGCFTRACNGVISGRIEAPMDVARDLERLIEPGCEDMYAILSTMITERPEDRADVADVLNSRLVRALSNN